MLTDHKKSEVLSRLDVIKAEAHMFLQVEDMGTRDAEVMFRNIAKLAAEAGKIIRSTN